MASQIEQEIEAKGHKEEPPRILHVVFLYSPLLYIGIFAFEKPGKRKGRGLLSRQPLPRSLFSLFTVRQNMTASRSWVIGTRILQRHRHVWPDASSSGLIIPLSIFSLDRVGVGKNRLYDAVQMFAIVGVRAISAR